MNIALILAGGNKKSDTQGIPVQFITINDKPIFIYTLESFQNHPQIDAIEVVCLDGWQDATQAFGRQFNITKLKWITKGGNTGQESIRNGIYRIREIVQDEDIIIIHDGIRPMVNKDVLSDVIRVATEQGNAVAATKFNEQMFLVDDINIERTNSFIDRDILRKVTTPQAFTYKDLLISYERAFRERIEIESNSYTDTMMVALGHSLHFAMGSDQNIKIETDEDIELFKSLLLETNSKWLK